MPGSVIPSTGELVRVLPEIVLTLAGTLVMALEPLRREGAKRILGFFALAGLAAALWATVAANALPGAAFRDMIVVDGFTTFFRALVIIVGMLTVLSSLNYLERERPDSGEYYALLLFSVCGQSLMAASGELIMLFIGLEISSISSYVLAGYIREDRRNNEAAIKYFLLGSFATAFLLYGVAWIYGITGTTDLARIGEILGNPEGRPPLILVGTSAALIFAGFAFKVSAAPFQAWAPDVYQGAPAPVAAFLSAGPKAAAFAALLRVYLTAFGPVGAAWEPVIWLAALATMIVGNFSAIWQSNVKRMLAYSSIAHAGYLLVAVTSRSEVGTAAAMFYLAAYAFMNVGAFAVVTHFARQRERFVEIDDFRGLGARQPVTAALFTIFLLSLIGIPLTGGFFGKFYIFKAALEARLVWLTVLGLLNSAVAAYYYLRVIVVMYFHEPSEATEGLPAASPGLAVAMWTSAVATLLLGIFPSAVLDFAGRSADLAK
jgi:NADH-quinone oxidoreductase subunit N